MKSTIRKASSWQAMTLALILTGGAALVFSGCGGGGGTATGAAQGGLPSVPNAPTSDFLALLPAAQKGAVNVGSDACGKCHGPTGGTVAASSLGIRPAAMSRSAKTKSSIGVGFRPLQATTGTTTATTPLKDLFTGFQQTAHFHQGIGCENCHGPGSAHVAAGGGTDNILTFPNILSTNVCGQCHQQIHSDWTLSKHASVVDAAISSGVGNAAAPCLRCHSETYHVKVVELGQDPGDLQQYANVKETAACGTCHNPHAITGNLNDSGEEVQLRHQIFNTNTAQVGAGATVAQYSTFNHECAICHNGRGVDASDAALQKATTRPSMHDSPQYNMLGGFGGADLGKPSASQAHFTIKGQCVTCHMYDGVGMHTFTVKFDNCSPCHTSSDAAARANSLRDEIQSRLLQLRTRLSAWSQSAFGDPDLWDYTSNVQALSKTAPDQTQVPIEIKRARHNYYFLINDGSNGIHNGTYARFLLDVASQGLDTLKVPAAVWKGAPNPSILESDRRRAVEAESRPDAY